MGYNAFKYLWFYGLKIHMLITLSDCALNNVVIPIYVYDIKAAYGLFEGRAICDSH